MIHRRQKSETLIHKPPANQDDSLKNSTKQPLQPDSVMGPKQSWKLIYSLRRIPIKPYWRMPPMLSITVNLFRNCSGLPKAGSSWFDCRGQSNAESGYISWTAGSTRSRMWATHNETIVKPGIQQLCTLVASSFFPFFKKFHICGVTQVRKK